MEILTHHIWDWLALSAFMALSLYVLRSIRQESSEYLDESYEVQFGELSLPIPQWWTIVRQENQLIEFARTDTHYSWYARFEFISSDSQTPLTEILHSKIEADEIDYDPQDVMIETDSRHLFKDPKTQSYFSEVIRVEGKASQKIEERIYLDLYLFRHKEENGHYVCESRSSVLNGGIEGPFFEECLSLITLGSDR